MGILQMTLQGSQFCEAQVAMPAVEESFLKPARAVYQLTPRSSLSRSWRRGQHLIDELALNSLSLGPKRT